MNKEELEKEAEEIYTKTDKEFMDCQDEGEIFNLGYLAGAEPREKQIQIDAEQIRALQKQNGELTDKVKEFEKENAELKERIKTLEQIKREHTDYTIKVEEERTFVKDQLAKATELIEDMYDQIPASHSDYYKDVMERARQFISEVEK